MEMPAPGDNPDALESGAPESVANHPSSANGAGEGFGHAKRINAAPESGANHPSPANRAGEGSGHAKPTKKQRLLEELKEVGAIVLYLAVSLSILETYKSLILLQLGVNEFRHNYTVALVEAVALGKIVALAQRLPVFGAFRSRPLAWSILIKSAIMTIIVDIGGAIEDHIFPRSAKLLAESGNPLVLIITHQMAAMSIFIILFTVRGAEALLGKEKLRQLFFSTPSKPID